VIAALWVAIALDALHRRANKRRLRAVRGSLARAQAATRQVLLAPSPRGLPLAWVAVVSGIPHLAARGVVLAVCTPLLALAMRDDVRSLKQTWAESRFPGDAARLRGCAPR
jgi:ABC-type transport system involved in cytochrome c biogenesis permease component